MNLPSITSSISVVDVISLLVLPILLPLLVGIVSNAKWPRLQKRLLLGGLSLVTTVLTDIVEHAVAATEYDITQAIIHWIAVWAAAEVAYYKLLKAPVEIAPQRSAFLPAVTGDDYDYTQHTVAQLQGFLGVRGIDWPKSANKSDLIALLEQDDRSHPISNAVIGVVEAAPEAKSIASIVQSKTSK